MEDEYISVSELNEHIRKLIASDSSLKEVYVRGEISNFKQNRQSGHCYFNVKDKQSIIPGIMYFSSARHLKFKPKDGMKVLIKGYVEVYKPYGKYSLYVTKLTEDGLGDLHIAFEQLKKELKELGWFDESHKKPIPKFPKRIGVVTAPTGAAIRDIITTIKRRWPLCEIILFPTLVQGNAAAMSIVRQVYTADTKFEIDTLIVGRGGGSIEDLWAFNDKILAKTIYHCNTPVISAVGHEIDFTIADFVADLRAPTPTAAAELAVPDKNEVESNLNNLNSRLKKQITNQYNDNRKKLEKIKGRNLFADPVMIYDKKAMHLDKQRDRLLKLSNEMVFENRMHLESLKRRLIESSNKMIYDNKIRLSKIKSSVVFKNPDRLFEDKSKKYFELRYKLKYSGDNLISKKENRLSQSKNSFIFKNPERLFENKNADYQKVKSRLIYGSNILIRDKKDDFRELKESNIIKNPDMILDKKKISLSRYMDMLSVLNPMETIKRGYTISRANGKIVSKAKDLKKDDELEVEFTDGKVNTRVL